MKQIDLTGFFGEIDGRKKSPIDNRKNPPTPQIADLSNVAVILRRIDNDKTTWIVIGNNKDIGNTYGRVAIVLTWDEVGRLGQSRLDAETIEALGDVKRILGGTVESRGAK